jgi:hypothetical protein
MLASLVSKCNTAAKIVGTRLAIFKTACQRGGWVLRASGAEPRPAAAQAQWVRFAMPTVSVKRDLLFQALGRTYSECPLSTLSSAPLLGGWHAF